MKLIIVGGEGGTHVAGSFYRAALECKFNPTHINSEPAYNAGLWLKQLNWRLRGKRPAKLNLFSKKVYELCTEFAPDVFLATGSMAAVNSQTLVTMRKQGVICINFLTDDPWNPAHYAPWFFKALLAYDIVLSPRHANLEDLRRIGCKRVFYLPFGYDPEFFYPEEPRSQEEVEQFSCDIVFAGGADQERVQYIDMLIRAGFDVQLYGAYWDRYPATKSNLCGYADTRTLRVSASTAKVVLGLVRRANRDGHSMRSYEVPAMKGCMLVEDTLDHRALFGDEGEAALYFSTMTEMIEKARWLLNQPAERKRLAAQAHQRVTQGKHTYRDRLEQILELANICH